MAKFVEKLKARQLRRGGESIKVIAKKLKVAPATVSVWCRDILLTREQIRRLEQRRTMAGYAGRLKGAQMQKNRRISLIEKFRKQGYRDLGKLSHRDFFLTGLGIYAGEGYKYKNVAGLTNSDPYIIKFMLRWFKEICQVTNDRFFCQIGINESHLYRVREVEWFWSKLIGIDLKQFWKTSLKKVKSKKVYEHPEEHFGTLAIRIRKSTALEYQILGWLNALLNYK